MTNSNEEYFVYLPEKNEIIFKGQIYTCINDFFVLHSRNVSQNSPNWREIENDSHIHYLGDDCFLVDKTGCNYFCNDEIKTINIFETSIQGINGLQKETRKLVINPSEIIISYDYGLSYKRYKLKNTAMSVLDILSRRSDEKNVIVIPCFI